MKEKWNNLPPWLKIAIIVVAVIIILILLVRVKTWLNAQRKAAQAQSEIKALKSKGITQSYNAATYSGWADKLETAMIGSWYDPTDEYMVNLVFDQLKNDVDFIYLNAAFGIRDGEDMRSWVKGDISQEEIDIINRQFKNKGMYKRL